MKSGSIVSSIDSVPNHLHYPPQPRTAVKCGAIVCLIWSVQTHLGYTTTNPELLGTAVPL